MEKKWLIRTYRKQILGPVTKDRVLSFIAKKALSGEDEISSGNGFWFYLREIDLVEKYLHNDEPQDFNPISEAASVLSKGIPEAPPSEPADTGPVLADTFVGSLGSMDFKKGIKEEEEEEEDKTENNQQQQEKEQEEEKNPPAADLEYPQMGEESDGETQLPPNEDLEYPTLDGPQQTNLPANDDLEYPVAEESAKPATDKAPDPQRPPSENIEDLPANGQISNLPPNDDLEYPDIGQPEAAQGPQNDNLGSSLATKAASTQPPAVAKKDTPPSMTQKDTKVNQQTQATKAPVKKMKAGAKKILKTKKKKTKIKVQKRDDRFLFLLLVLAAILLGLILRYYPKILTLKKETSYLHNYLIGPVVSVTYAADNNLGSLSKKKVSLNLMQSIT